MYTLSSFNLFTLVAIRHTLIEMFYAEASLSPTQGIRAFWPVSRGLHSRVVQAVAVLASVTVLTSVIALSCKLACRLWRADSTPNAKPAGVAMFDSLLHFLEELCTGTRSNERKTGASVAVVHTSIIFEYKY